MTGQIITCRHEVYDLPELLEWTVVHTGSVPCDTYAVTFLYDKTMAEPLHLAAGFLAMADGAVVQSGEAAGYREISIFKDGVTL